MARYADYRYSAAVEYAQSHWDSVNNRIHYKMQEDGSVVLVDPNHRVSWNVEIHKIDPARLSPFEVQPTDPTQPGTQHGAQITINKLGKSRLSPFEPSSSNGSAGHSSVPAIGKKLNPSLVSYFDQPKVEPFSKVASPLMSNVRKFAHQDTIVVTGMNEIMGSAPRSNIKQPKVNRIQNIKDIQNIPSKISIRSKHLDDKSIDGTKAMPRYMTDDTVSNASKRRNIMPVTARSGFNHYTKTGPGFQSKIPIPTTHLINKVPSIDNTNAMPRYMTDETVASASRRRTKIALEPVNYCYKAQFMADTVASASKRRSKTEMADCLRPFHHTNNERIPEFPPDLPGKRNSKYDSVPSRHRLQAAKRELKTKDLLPCSHQMITSLNIDCNINATLKTNDWSTMPIIQLQLDCLLSVDSPMADDEVTPTEASKESQEAEFELPVVARIDDIVPVEICKLPKKEILNISPVVFDLTLENQKEYSIKYIETDESLGQGAFGIVRKGIRIGDNKPVAIKTIDAKNVKNWGQLTDGRHCPLEICLLTKLKGCDKVNQLQDAYYIIDEDSHRYILVLDLIDECIPLDKYIVQYGPVDEDEAKHIFNNLVIAVSNCHEYGVVHRDIKEANILLDYYSTPQIIDFGCAVLAESSPFTDIPGTRLYQAPELFDPLGVCYEGVPSDIYALGIVLYDMMYGKIAKCFSYSQSVEKRDAVSKHWLDLSTQMTSSNPKDRPTFTEVLNHPWFKEE